MAAALHVGTSGWNYNHWRETFYAKGLSASRWLPFYAEHFDTVELNSSFYRIPSPGSVERWAAQTPDRFTFAVKLWRGITHYRKLINCASFLESFFTVMNGIPAAKRAPLLIQAPPNQSLDLGKLESFWPDLQAANHRRWRIAIEFRHPSWLVPEVYRFLDRHRAALCLHDMPGRADTATPNDAAFVYVRRHGTGEGRYNGEYSGSQINEDATRIRAWLAEGREVYVYYNNDIGGHALTNARQLREELT
jgi:uncharacterized protein YecE (DUF72 family)